MLKHSIVISKRIEAFIHPEDCKNYSNRGMVAAGPSFFHSCSTNEGHNYKVCPDGDNKQALALTELATA